METEEIACDLDELPCPFVFDVVAYESIKNPQLRRHIDTVGVVVYEVGR